MNQQILDNLNNGIPCWIADYYHKPFKSRAATNCKPVSVSLRPNKVATYIGSTNRLDSSLLEVNTKKADKTIPSNINLSIHLFLTQEEATDHYVTQVNKTIVELQNYYQNSLDYIRSNLSKI